MYEVDGKDLRTIRRSIDSCLSIGVPLVIGEFSDSQGGKPVDYKSLMSYCKSRSVGWIAWCVEERGIIEMFLVVVGFLHC